MKKILAIAICGLMLAGCGKAATETTVVESESVSESIVETPEATETPEPTPTALPDPTETPTPEPTPTEDPRNQNIDEGDGYWLERVYLHNDINAEMTSGPAKITINSLGFSRLIIDDQDLADLYEAPLNEECTMLVMAVTFENTSDSDVFIDSSFTVTTNTKQQVLPNFESDFIDGNFYGAVVQEGYLYFTLDKTIANELTEVTIRANAPWDINTGEDLGEDMSCTINIADYANEIVS